MNGTRVVNIRGGEPYDVYIGRPSKWGNPLVIGLDGDREAVIRGYRGYVESLIAQRMCDLEELRGKRLGCFCAPLPCHGDVLVELLEGEDPKHQEYSEP